MILIDTSCARCSICNTPIPHMVKQLGKTIARIMCGMCTNGNAVNDNERSEAA